MREMSECPAVLVTMLISVSGLGSVDIFKKDHIKVWYITNWWNIMLNSTGNVQTCIHGDRFWQFYGVKNIREDGSWQLILDLWEEKEACDMKQKQIKTAAY